MVEAGRIAIAAPVLSQAEMDNVMECINTNWISSKGRFINEFEKGFAAKVGAKHAIAVTSGTTALHVALAALGVGPGDEVILPTFTMIACANVITQLGAKPVLVDSEMTTWNIDPVQVREKLTPRTKAIMPVHIYGHPIQMDELKEVLARRNIPILEDGAEAHGAKYKGNPVGSLATISAFSFYANKIITTGEGGMVTTNDDALANAVLSLRDQGYDLTRRKWLIHNRIGYNYRLTNLQAAVGLAQLKRMDEFVEHHRKVATLYNSLLQHVPGITLPPEQPWAKNVYWMYTILVDGAAFGMSKDDLMTKLGEAGIDTRSAFLPIHQQQIYAKGFLGQSYPVADRLSAQGVNLPSGNNTTEEEVHRVAATIASLARK